MQEPTLSSAMLPLHAQVIQLQGDQRKNVSEFLIKTKITKKEHIKLHGF